MPDATCKTCVFWEARKGQEEQPDSMGICHHARSYLGPDDNGFRSSGWCSEHPARQRDRLAAMIAQGMVAHPGVWGDMVNGRSNRDVARSAYALADALIAEGSRRG